ncbi:MAG: cytochrome-c peroxidase [Woeseiaceae bacterium]
MRRAVILGAAAALLYLVWYHWPASPKPWTDADLEILRSLSIENLPPLPADASNAVADDPRAANLGHALFFDARLSVNGGISCATCHQPERNFTDGLPKGQAIGTSKRNTPSIVGTAYSPWLYWDGRRDSQWSQALSPLEDQNEHATNRGQVVTVVSEDPNYAAIYEELFDARPDTASTESVDQAFANIGKIFAAYERLLQFAPAPFDEYVAAVLADDTTRQAELMSDDEVAGLQLFIGKANCTQCHNGPLFTNNEFHNTGVISAAGELPDKGRVVGAREVVTNQFNCSSEFSDDGSRTCAELDFMRTGPELIGAFRTPSLRNVADTAPYMHKGQLATLADTLQHYNDAPDAMIGHNEAKPLKLGSGELRQLEAFLFTLSSPLASDAEWLRAP